MKKLLKAIRKLIKFYFKNIEAVIIIGSLLLLSVFVLALMEWFSNSFPVVSLIISVLILIAANTLTKSKAL